MRRFTSLEARIDAAAHAVLDRLPTHGLYGAAVEFVVFGLKQGWACLFGGAMLALIIGTRLLWPDASIISRYDFLFLAALGILDHFNDIFDIVAADLTPKPARETYDKFVGLHRVDTAHAVMFEDLARNLAVPKALGMTTVLIVPITFEPSFSEIWERVADNEDEVVFVTVDLAGFLTRIYSGIAH